jgi:NADH dehydrogenase
MTDPEKSAAPASDATTVEAAAPVDKRPRVVIVGCGFGGLAAVRELARAPVQITLVDRTNHHLFQPLLCQVATAGLSAPAVSAPIRHVLRHEMAHGNLTVLQAEVTAIDTAAREVVLDGAGARPGAIDRLPYDHLIVAAGATHSYSATPTGRRTR